MHHVHEPTVLREIIVVPRRLSLLHILCLSQGATIKRILPAIVPHMQVTPLQPSQTESMPDPVTSTISTSSEKLPDNHSQPCSVKSTDGVTTKPLPEGELPASSGFGHVESASQPPCELEKPVPPEGSMNASGSEEEREDDLIEKQDEESRSLLLSASKSAILRVNSMVISEWSVEHTLKLRDEGKSPEVVLEEAEGGEHSGDERDDSKTASPMPDAELDLPSTPKPLPSNGASKVDDWWSEALAQNQDIDNFDNLIDKLDTPAASKSVSSGKQKASPQKLPEQKLLPRSPPTTDGNRRDRDSREPRLEMKKSQSPQLVSERRSSPSIETGAYIVQAGKLITQGLEYEQLGELDEAFDLFKAGVDVLLNGVQSEMSVTILL